MSELHIMLKKAFASSPSQNYYELVPWTLSFVKGTWDITFTLFFYKKKVLFGSMSDKTLTVLCEEPDLKQKVLQDFSLVLPTYKVIDFPKENGNG